MRLPQLSVSPAPEWQMERLARWLHEWEIDQVLASAEDDGLGSASGDPARGEAGQEGALPPDATAPLDAEPPVACGQVRLLSPSLPPAGHRPIYLAVLDEPASGRFLCAPYSRFSEPATPGELLARPDVSCLRVLSAWNARVVPSGILSQSWLVDGLSAEEIQDARAVLKHAAADRELPASLLTRVGPPLRHPADPRIEYVEQESALMAALGDRDARWTYEPDPAAFGLGLDSSAPRELPLAAESPGDYGRPRSDAPPAEDDDAGGDV